jgi:hypothetical protein
VLGLSAQLEAMKNEVLRLRRWQFGRSAEVLDPTIAPPLPLQDLEFNATPIEAARLYSLIGTCRLNGIDPYRYLRHALERIAAHPINRIDELLPWRVAPQWAEPLHRAA